MKTIFLIIILSSFNCIAQSKIVSYQKDHCTIKSEDQIECLRITTQNTFDIDYNQNIILCTDETYNYTTKYKIEEKTSISAKEIIMLVSTSTGEKLDLKILKDRITIQSKNYPNVYMDYFVK